jgi:hypothetical protein
MPSSTSKLRRASHTSGLGHQPPVAIDHCHLAAESPRRLGHLHSDVAPTDSSKCSGIIAFKGLDMRERLRFRKARNYLQRGTRGRTNDHIRAPPVDVWSHRPG